MKQNLREIKRMQKLANINECGCKDNIEEMDQASQSMVGAGIGVGITIAVALKSIVASYKQIKKSNPEIATKDAILQSLSQVSGQISKAKQ